MTKFLNTSATNYFLGELIKGTKDRLVLICPFIKLNDRMKELLLGLIAAAWSVYARRQRLTPR